jgi:translation initiation factor IF-1
VGSDQAVKGRQSGQTAEVVELLPSAAYRLRLEDETVVTAHAAGSTERNFVRLRPGDRVRVVLSPRDRTRGRIVEKL